MNEVDISEHNVPSPQWKPRLKRFARAVLRKLDKRRWFVSVLLCDDAYMRTLNRTYRGIDAPTDVLSFRQADSDTVGLVGAPSSRTVGDIVISLDTVGRNAHSAGGAFDEELKRVLVHGVLHLDGKDHDEDNDDDPMIRLQDELLCELSRRRIV